MSKLKNALRGEKEFSITSNPGVMEQGEHEVVVISAEMSHNENTGTPEIVFVLENEDKAVITAYLHTVGYKKDEFGEFELDNDGNRIVDPTETEKALRYCGTFAYACGVEPGEQVQPNDLKGRVLNITVENKIYNGKSYRKVTEFSRT